MSEINTAGVDGGSSSVKGARGGGPGGAGRGREGTRLLSRHTERVRRRDQKQVVEMARDEALKQAGLDFEQVDYWATTGEGELVDFRTGHFYGMTAHARGALFLEPETRAVLDVGGLHARAIKMDERAKVEGYRMTSQCASGSGQFLENIARYLGVTLDEVGPLSLEARDPEKVSSICAVLAETDVINMVSRGITLPNILRGIHESMADRCAKLLRASKIKSGVVLVSGGLSADVGLVQSIRDALEKIRLTQVDVRVHPDGVYAGALGAALWGAYRYERLEAAA